jgi:tRNA-dihydrouridine synthase
LGNGDVRTPAGCEQMQAQTGVDGVMIGRGAIGNPWIFSRLERSQVPPDIARVTLVSHLERMLSFYGTERGLILFRKHASRYISPLPLTRMQRGQLLTAGSPAEFMEFFDELFVVIPT